MSIHVGTGNHLNIVLDYVDGKEKIIGLQQWGKDEIIPLPFPDGLADVLSAEIARLEYNLKGVKK